MVALPRCPAKYGSRRVCVPGVSCYRPVSGLQQETCGTQTRRELDIAGHVGKASSAGAGGGRVAEDRLRFFVFLGGGKEGSREGQRDRILVHSLQVFRQVRFKTSLRAGRFLSQACFWPVARNARHANPSRTGVSGTPG